MNAGISYRLGGQSKKGFGESVDLMVGVQATRELRLGLSYDITFSDLRKSGGGGSVEAMLRFCFGSEEEVEILNPRFF
jgi:hypothetical protein